jgi:hypothetical protein
MTRKDKDDRLNIQSNLVRDSTFVHHERDDYFKSLSKKRRRDSNSNIIYVFLLFLLSARLFSMIISGHLNNVKDTHIEMNAIILFLYILTLKKRQRRRR